MESIVCIVSNIIIVIIVVYALINAIDFKSKIKKIQIIVAVLGVGIGMAMQMAALEIEEFSVFVGLITSLTCSGYILKVVKEERTET